MVLGLLASNQLLQTFRCPSMLILPVNSVTVIRVITHRINTILRVVQLVLLAILILLVLLAMHTPLCSLLCNNNILISLCLNSSNQTSLANIIQFFPASSNFQPCTPRNSAYTPSPCVPGKSKHFSARPQQSIQT